MYLFAVVVVTAWIKFGRRESLLMNEVCSLIDTTIIL